jgi:hypothetical protein
MKRLHRPDLFTWSCFDESRNVDFFSVAWIRAGGNVLIDPLTMSGHDRAHFQGLGGAALIIVTNSDHVRGAPALAQGGCHPVRATGRAGHASPAVRPLAGRECRVEQDPRRCYPARTTGSRHFPRETSWARIGDIDINR